MMQDIQLLENQVTEDQERIKQYSKMIEHVEIICDSKRNNDTKYLEENLNTQRTRTT